MALSAMSAATLVGVAAATVRQSQCIVATLAMVAVLSMTRAAIVADRPRPCMRRGAGTALAAAVAQGAAEEVASALMAMGRGPAGAAAMHQWPNAAIRRTGAQAAFARAGAAIQEATQSRRRPQRMAATMVARAAVLDRGMAIFRNGGSSGTAMTGLKRSSRSEDKHAHRIHQRRRMMRSPGNLLRGVAALAALSWISGEAASTP